MNISRYESFLLTKNAQLLIMQNQYNVILYGKHSFGNNFIFSLCCILIVFLIIQRAVVIPTEKTVGKIPEVSSV